jgi:hypothetical protein
MALKQAWAGDSMRILPPTRSPRQQIRGLLLRIRALATQLNLDKLEIEPVVLDGLQIAPDTLAKLKRDANEPDKVCYLDALEENVDNLCGDDFGPAKGTFTYFRGQVNGLLLYWDTLIYEKLQAMSTDPVYSYLNAYLVGRGFAIIRWDLAPGEPVQDRAKMEHELVNLASLHRLRDYAQLMAPSLPKFAAPALAYSVKRWGDAFLQQKVNGGSSLQLQDQAEIWQNLLTGRRDPTTYIAPSTVALRYTLKVILFCLPLILLGILLAVGIILLILLLVGFLVKSLPPATNTFVTTVAAFVVGGAGAGGAVFVGITQTKMIRGIWDWLSPNLLTAATQSRDTAIGGAQAAVMGSNAQSSTENAQPSLVTMLWEAAQQEVINNATYIPVPSVTQRLRTALAHSPSKPMKH